MHVPCILKVLATITSYYYNQKKANNNTFPDFLTKKNSCFQRSSHILYDCLKMFLAQSPGDTNTSNLYF